MALHYPEDLRYTETHEYLRMDGEVATIGITAFAVDQLGDIVFLELPEVGAKVSKGGSFGSIESVKAVEDLKSPVTGEVLDRNMNMVDAPEKLTEDPYLDGWLLKVKLSDMNEATSGMIASEYRAKVEGA
ncbi:MAG: glycine cleavage system protein GcvH [Alkalinema sp. RU_4_3]|nr:glycine cleavage system protein GcvH [Alkalinema sp. RU_4_3]